MSTTAAVPTVPIASNRLEGWTSCCAAAVTFSGDGVLCCKACWREVEPLPVGGQAGDELGEIVESVLKGDITPDEGVQRQQALLAEPLPEATREQEQAAEALALDCDQVACEMQPNGDLRCRCVTFGHAIPDGCYGTADSVRVVVLDADGRERR